MVYDHSANGKDMALWKIVFRSGNRHDKKQKEIQYERYNVNQISFKNYIKWTNVMLPPVFEEFEMFYICLLFFW